MKKKEQKTKRKLRKSLVFAAGVFLAGFLSGCQRSQSEFTVLTEEYLKNGVEAAVEYYESQNPEITIEIQTLPAQREERQARIKALKTKSMTGEGADIYVFDTLYDGAPYEEYGRNTEVDLLFPDVYKVMQADIFADLKGFMEQDEDLKREELQEGILAAGEYKGKQYILPLFYSMDLAYMDKDYAQQTGWDSTVSVWEAEEYQEKVLEKNVSGINTWAANFLRGWIPGFLTAGMDYEKAELAYSKEDMIAVIKEYKDFTSQMEYEGKHALPMPSEWGEETYFTNPVSGALPTIEALPKEESIYEKGRFSALESPEGEIFGWVRTYGAVGRGCRNPETAYEILSVFLKEEFQNGGVLSAESKQGSNSFFQHSIPLRKSAWERLLFYNVTYENEADFGQLMEVFDCVNRGIFPTQSTLALASFLESLEELDKEQIQTLGELYDGFEKTLLE